MNLEYTARGLQILAAIVAATFISAPASAEISGVSPGDTEHAQSIYDPCPTFSWTAEAGSGYELQVYRVNEDDYEAAEPVFAKQLPSGATSWTAAEDMCLPPGHRYAWSVRSLTIPMGADTDVWSDLLLFEVPDTALTVREIVAMQREVLNLRESQGRAHSAQSGNTAGRLPDGPPALPDLAINADGNMQATHSESAVLRLTADHPIAESRYSVDLRATSLGYFSVGDAVSGNDALRIDDGAPSLSLYINGAGQISGNGSLLSNVDADLLDGLDSSNFAQIPHNHTGVYAPFSHEHSIPVKVWESGTDNITPEGQNVDIAQFSVPGAGVVIAHVWVASGHCTLTGPADIDVAQQPFEPEEAVLIAYSTGAQMFTLNCTATAGGAGGNFVFRKGVWIPASLEILDPLPPP